MSASISYAPLVKSFLWLFEILKDLGSDPMSFGGAIDRISEYIKMEEWALKQFEYTHHQVDNLWVSFSDHYFNYSINDRTFQKIQNAGKSTFLRFDDVYESIVNYYTGTKESLDISMAWDMKTVTKR